MGSFFAKFATASGRGDNITGTDSHSLRVTANSVPAAPDYLCCIRMQVQAQIEYA